MSRPSNSNPHRLAPLLGFALLGGLLVAIFANVLEKRFESGEIYPHYSTLRSDPLGSRALYDSLNALPGLEVIRNRRPLMTIAGLDGETTLWLNGLSRPAFEGLRAPEDSPVLRAVREEGARLVITLNPQVVPEKFDLADDETESEFEDWWEKRERIRRQSNGEEEKAEPEEKAEETAPDSSSEKTTKERDQEDLEEEQEAHLGERLTELLEVALAPPSAFTRPEEGWEVEPGHHSPSSKAPADIPRWRSQLRFSDLGPDWKVAGAIDGTPVVVERSLGAGTVVLASDSYFTSNEALWKGADPGFLLWLLGAKPRLVFDETIHGTVESGGTMKIIRRYRLHGFFIGLFLFLALLAWKSGTSLSPGSEAVERGLVDGGGAVAGEETSSGMIRLLRRNVPSKRLLRTCLEVWRDSAGHRRRGESEGQRAAIDGIVARHESDPRSLPLVEAFRRITHVLAHPDEFREGNPS